MPGMRSPVRHDVGPLPGQCAQPAPEPAQHRNVEEILAVLETGLDPRVVGREVTPTVRPGEGPAAGVGGTECFDDSGQIAGEIERGARVGVDGDRAGDPGLHRPRHRVAGPGFAERDRNRHRDRAVCRQVCGGRGFALSLRPSLVERGAAQRESSAPHLPDPVDRVDRPAGRDPPDRVLAPLRELVGNQISDDIVRDGDLVRVHAHGQVPGGGGLSSDLRIRRARSSTISSVTTTPAGMTHSSSRSPAMRCAGSPSSSSSQK